METSSNESKGRVLCRRPTQCLCFTSNIHVTTTCTLLSSISSYSSPGGKQNKKEGKGTESGKIPDSPRPFLITRTFSCSRSKEGEKGRL
jgi:hypothetical protein